MILRNKNNQELSQGSLISSRKKLAVNSPSDAEAFLTKEPTVTAQTLLDFSCDRAKVADGFYALPKGNP